MNFSVSTSNGQPSAAIYDWNMGTGLTDNGERISLETLQRLLISRFCDKVTKSLYTNPSEVVGILPISELPAAATQLETEYHNLEALSDQFTRKCTRIS